MKFKRLPARWFCSHEEIQSQWRDLISNNNSLIHFPFLLLIRQNKCHPLLIEHSHQRVSPSILLMLLLYHSSHPLLFQRGIQKMMILSLMEIMILILFKFFALILPSLFCDQLAEYAEYAELTGIVLLSFLLLFCFLLLLLTIQ